MDKNSISIYGWIVVVVVIIAIMIAAAAPFSSFVTGGIVDIVDGFGKTNNSSNDSGNIGGSGDQGESGESGGANHVCTPGVAATCTSDQTCTDPSCGTVIVAATGHNATTEWTTDENYHWHECLNGCGAELDKGEHSPNMNISDATDSDKVYCTDCEYVIKEVVEYATIYMNPKMYITGVVGYSNCYLLNEETGEKYQGHGISVPAGTYTVHKPVNGESVYCSTEEMGGPAFWYLVKMNSTREITLSPNTSYYFTYSSSGNVGGDTGSEETAFITNSSGFEVYANGVLIDGAAGLVVGLETTITHMEPITLYLVSTSGYSSVEIVGDVPVSCLLVAGESYYIVGEEPFNDDYCSVHLGSHFYEPGLEYYEPTCLDAGRGDMVCVCGDKYWVEYPPLGHDFSNESTVCNRCGAWEW